MERIAAIFAFILLVGVVPHAEAARPNLKPDQILNESASKRPATVRTTKKLPAGSTVFELTSPRSSEALVKNTTTQGLCIEFKPTPTAPCSPNICDGTAFFLIDAGETFTFPLPKSPAGFGKICGQLRGVPNDPDSEAVYVVERDQ